MTEIDAVSAWVRRYRAAWESNDPVERSTGQVETCDINGLEKSRESQRAALTG